jgi:predicted nucleic acid-binding protein
MCHLLIDTNILLDAIDPSRPDSNSARELLDRCSGWGELGMACASSFTDTYYISRKLYGEARGRTIVRHLMSLLAIAPVDAEVCDMALNSDEPDFEDGVIRACAELNGADFIITRDRAAFAHSKIRSVTAAEYLEIARANDRGYPWRGES